MQGGERHKAADSDVGNSSSKAASSSCLRAVVKLQCIPAHVWGGMKAVCCDLQEPKVGMSSMCGCSHIPRRALLLLGHQGSGDCWLAGQNPRNICIVYRSKVLLSILPFCLLVLFLVLENTGIYSSAPQTKVVAVSVEDFARVQ